MLLQLTASAYFDFLQQFASLARDPVGYGVGVPRGDGRPILLIPGFTAGDWSLGTLARWLGRDRIQAVPVGNRSQRRMSAAQGGTGWMAREKIAREIRPARDDHRAQPGRRARTRDRCVEPGNRARSDRAGIADSQRMDGSARSGSSHAAGDPDHSGKHFPARLENCGTMECSCGIADAVFAPTPPRSRFSAIYTRRDEVVQWQACIDDEGTQLRSVGTAREPDRQSRGLSAAGGDPGGRRGRERSRLNLSCR